MSYRLYNHLMLSNYRKLSYKVKSLTKANNYDKSKKQKDQAR